MAKPQEKTLAMRGEFRSDSMVVGLALWMESPAML